MIARAAHPGSLYFLLSDGRYAYAHRAGRTLFLLERRPGDAVRLERALESETGRDVETAWSPARKPFYRV